MRFFR